MGVYILRKLYAGYCLLYKKRLRALVGTIVCQPSSQCSLYSIVVCFNNKLTGCNKALIYMLMDIKVRVI